ncbi:hypothetical protein FDI36_gp127 [Streptomyces phage NootNoot]|uniref:Uncharacterized protein n=1 Tax=Streptomyces phage NootNoot TaxID=2023992 RepID=A0A222Z010_9CAUD|nr:hypothetical protein FDI36_gp127 [Streptomyces phage NootNoot]ASR77394.1 hypothetical protein SEA_NOOTNOOT_147 [Streptomyces phage NootNoot]
MPYDEELGCVRETKKFNVTLKEAAWDNKEHTGPQPGLKGECFEQRLIDGDWFYYIKFPGWPGFHIAYAHQVSR